ncbi:MAG: NuoM family protein [Chthoniobacterales bacterium]
MSPLIFAILLPVLGGIFCFVSPIPQKTARITALAGFLLTLYLFFFYDRSAPGYQFTSEYAILPGFGLNFLLGVDGFSLVMLLLTSVVTLAAVWATNAPEKSPGLYYGSLLFISAGAIGAFVSVDVFFFYIFHELALIPTFLLIGIWGTGDRQAAAWKATIYLALGSFVLLIGLILLYLSCPEGARTFDMRELTQLAENNYLATNPLIYFLLLFGFGTLVSLFPFHSWAPSAYACAPAPAAMLHAGVLKKFGVYGLLRLVVPIFPIEIQQYANIVLVLLACNILYVGYVTVSQKRLDWTLGYSSVMHMGYIFLGIVAMNQVSMTGAGIVMFGHGLAVAALFAMSGIIREKTGTLEYSELGGLAQVMPKTALLFGFATMASIGLPGFANFAGELLVFFGAFAAGDIYTARSFQIATACAIWGIVISALYMLRAYRNIFFGELLKPFAELTEAPLSTRLSLVLLVGLLLLFGFYPQLLIAFIGPALN